MFPKISRICDDKLPAFPIQPDNNCKENLKPEC